MRDDTIEVTGPFEVPSYWVEEEIDPYDGEVIPAYWVDMSRVRVLNFETRACPCGGVHGSCVTFLWDLATTYPELCEKLIDEAYRYLYRLVDDCEHRS
jgi:hypothetical protein